MRLPAFLLYVKNGRKIRRGPFERDPSDPACTPETMAIGVDLLRRHGQPKSGDALVLLEVHGDPAEGVSVEAISFSKEEIARMAALAKSLSQTERRRRQHGDRTRMAPAFSV
jgi:hypothetical protein